MNSDICMCVAIVPKSIHVIFSIITNISIENNMYSWLHNLNTYYLNLILISFLLNATQNAIYTDTHSID